MFLSHVPITPSQSKIFKPKNSPDKVPRNSDEISDNQKNADEEQSDDDLHSILIQCTLCREVFNDKKRLKFHNLFSCTQRRFQCPKCEMKFVKLEHLNQHLKLHGTMAFLCYFEGCNVDFWSSEYLHEHQRIKGHFGNNDAMEVNVKRIRNKEWQWEAPDSSEDSSSSSDSSECETFDCDLCGKYYGSNSGLKRHKRDKHNIEVPPRNLSKEQVEAYFSPDRNHKCRYCDLRFNHLESLKYHVSKHKEYTFKCQTCGFKYRRQEILDEHKKLVHQPKVEEPKLSTNLQSVEDYFSLDRKYFCVLCDLRFNHLHSLKYHINKHDEYKFECETCGSNYRRKIILDYHQMKAHGKKINFRTFKCQKCSSIFYRRDNLYQHLRGVHKMTVDTASFRRTLNDSQAINRKSKKFKCFICKMSYVNQGNLTIHKRKVHNIIRAPLHWIKVAKFFSLKRKFSCDLCGLRYPSRSGVLHHKRNHASFKFKCEIDGCGMNFWHEVFLNEHQKRAHGADSSMVIDDEIMNSKKVPETTTEDDPVNNSKETSQTFEQQMSSNSRKRALKKSNQDQKDYLELSDDAQTFRCKKCPKVYNKRDLLSQHYRTAHKLLLRFSASKLHQLFSLERNYPCDLCDLRFNGKNSLNRHQVSHYGFKFQCSECGFKYWRQEILDEHKRRAHGIENQTQKFENEHNNFVLPASKIHQLFSSKRPFACHLCDLRFMQKIPVLRDHLKSHDRFKFKCHECGFKYWRQEILDEHKKRVHKNEKEEDRKEIQEVEKIQETKAPNSSITESEKTSLNSTQILKRQLNCSKCDATFSHRKHLNAHLKEIHDTFDEKWQSEIPKKFSLKKPFACQKCDLRFTKENVLNLHLKGHENFKFECNVEGCGNKYRHGEVLREHQRRAHVQLEIHLKFTCEISDCKKKFGDKKDLKEHQETAHKTSNDNNNEHETAKDENFFEPEIVLKTQIKSEVQIDDNQNLNVESAIIDIKEEDDFIQELLGHLLDDEAPEILSENGIKQEKIQDTPNLIKTTENNQFAIVDYSQKHYDENVPNDITRELQKDEYSRYDKVIHEKLANIKTEVPSCSYEKVQPAVGTWICLECAANYSDEDQLWSHMRQNDHFMPVSTIETTQR